MAGYPYDNDSDDDNSVHAKPASPDGMAYVTRMSTADLAASRGSVALPLSGLDTVGPHPARPVLYPRPGQGASTRAGTD